MKQKFIFRKIRHGSPAPRRSAVNTAKCDSGIRSLSSFFIIFINIMDEIAIKRNFIQLFFKKYLHLLAKYGNISMQYKMHRVRIRKNAVKNTRSKMVLAISVGSRARGSNYSER